MKNLKLLLILIFVGISTAAYSQAATLPEFTFYKLDGSRFTKSDVQTRTNSVIVFFDVTCSHCQQETERLGSNYAKFKNTAFYMVSMDEVPAILKFMGSYGKLLNNKKNVTLLQDKDRLFIPRFMPTRYPAIFVYSPKGKLIKHFSGEVNVKEIIDAANQ